MGATVLACRSKHPFPVFGWLIEWVQNKNYSHYAIRAGDYVLDSSIKGVHWTKLEDFHKKYKIVKTWSFLNIDTYPMFYWSARYSSHPYSIIQNLGYGFKLLGLSIPNPWGNEEKNLNCSELVALWTRDFVHVAIKDSDEYDLIEVEKLLNNLGDAIKWEAPDVS
jgi:hypothetical protein